MTEAEKVPVEVGEKEMEQPATSEWGLLQNVRKEIDRLFEDFNLRSWRLPFARGPGEIEPLWRGYTSWGSAPFVDVVDKEHSYEVTAELPGMDPSNISVKFSTGTLTIKGEKKEEKEEKGKDYVLSGNRRRCLRCHEGNVAGAEVNGLCDGLRCERRQPSTFLRLSSARGGSRDTPKTHARVNYLTPP